MMDIGKDLQNAYKEGYKQGYEQGKKDALDYEKSMREEAIYHEAYSEERGMTREEAIRIIETVFQDEYVYKYYDSITHQALDMAIEALKQVTGKLKNPDDSLLTADPEACKEQKSKLDLISRQDAIDALQGRK